MVRSRVAIGVLTRRPHHGGGTAAPVCAVLADYLRTKNITVPDVFRACMPKLDAGTYKYCRARLAATVELACQRRGSPFPWGPLVGYPAPTALTPTPTQPTSASKVCRDCASAIFGDLCYLYRCDIPNSQLPRTGPRAGCLGQNGRMSSRRLRACEVYATWCSGGDRPPAL